MIIYLCTSFSRRAEMREVRAQILEIRGLRGFSNHNVVSSWIDSTHEDPLLKTLYDIEERKKHYIAITRCYNEVKRCDTLIHFTGTVSIGRHVEWGIAWAMGKRRVIVGPLEHIFHVDPGIHARFPNWDECHSWLKETLL